MPVFKVKLNNTKMSKPTKSYWRDVLFPCNPLVLKQLTYIKRRANSNFKDITWIQLNILCKNWNLSLPKKLHLSVCIISPCKHKWKLQIVAKKDKIEVTQILVHRYIFCATIVLFSLLFTIGLYTATKVRDKLRPKRARGKPNLHKRAPETRYGTDFTCQRPIT